MNAQRLVGPVIVAGLLLATLANLAYRQVAEEHRERPVRFHESSELAHVLEVSGEIVARRYLLYAVTGEVIPEDGTLAAPPELGLRPDDALAIGGYRLVIDDRDHSVDAATAAAFDELASVEVVRWVNGRTEVPHIVVEPPPDAMRFRAVVHDDVVYIVDEGTYTSVAEG